MRLARPLRSRKTPLAKFNLDGFANAYSAQKSSHDFFVASC
jgi:hypothetical protein